MPQLVHWTLDNYLHFIHCYVVVIASSLESANARKMGEG